MVSSFGNIIFEVSEKKIYTYTDLSEKLSLEFEEQEVQGSAPKIYIKNESLTDLSFRVQLIKMFGVDLLEEKNKWYTLLKSKKPQELILNDKKIGKQWLLIDVDFSEEIPNQVANISVNLKQFLGYGKAEERETDKEETSASMRNNREINNKE